MANVLPDEFLKMLDAEEAEVYRQWARENYERGKLINPCWHPVVRAECYKINEEA